MPCRASVKAAIRACKSCGKAPLFDIVGWGGGGRGLRWALTLPRGVDELVMLAVVALLLGEDVVGMGGLSSEGEGVEATEDTDGDSGSESTLGISSCLEGAIQKNCLSQLRVEWS